MGGGDSDNDSYGHYDDRLNDEDKLSVDLDDVVEDDSEGEVAKLSDEPDSTQAEQDMQKSTDSGSDGLRTK